MRHWTPLIRNGGQMQANHTPQKQDAPSDTGSREVKPEVARGNAAEASFMRWFETKAPAGFDSMDDMLAFSVTGGAK